MRKDLYCSECENLIRDGEWYVREELGVVCDACARPIGTTLFAELGTKKA